MRSNGRPKLPLRQSLRTLPLAAIDAPRLTFSEVVDDGHAGRTEVFPQFLVTRAGRLRIDAPAECVQQLNKLRDCFIDRVPRYFRDVD
jgi:hypothetical protein